MASTAPLLAKLTRSALSGTNAQTVQGCIHPPVAAVVTASSTNAIRKLSHCVGTFLIMLFSNWVNRPVHAVAPAKVPNVPQLKKLFISTKYLSSPKHSNKYYANPY